MRSLILLAWPATALLLVLSACGGSVSSPGTPSPVSGTLPPAAPTATADKAADTPSPAATARPATVAEPRELTTIYFVHAGG